MIVLEDHNARFKNGEALTDSVSHCLSLRRSGLVTEDWPLLDTARWKKAVGM
jgi:hypothetical protein